MRHVAPSQRRQQHKQADRKAQEHLKAKPKCVRMAQKVVAFEEVRLADGRSPEQISGRMKAEGMPSVSHEAIYWHVWLNKANGAARCTNLRHSSKPKFRFPSIAARGQKAANGTRNPHYQLRLGNA